jgi:hypothetical protein
LRAKGIAEPPLGAVDWLHPADEHGENRISSILGLQGCDAIDKEDLLRLVNKKLNARVTLPIFPHEETG